MLSIENISKTFELDKEEIVALSNISFKVSGGEFLVVVGPSGSGKSTLLRIIAGLTPPTQGRLEWDEKPRIGFVFQNYALFPYLTVYENIEFGLKMHEVSKSEIKPIVLDLIKEVGLQGFENKHPKELSGGMKQRVGIARALAISPNVLLLDEPFSSLDEFTAEELRQLFLDLWQKRQITVVMITHLITEALVLADKVVVLSEGPGQVKKVLGNNLVRPRDQRSAKFFQMEDELKKLIQG